MCPPQACLATGTAVATTNTGRTGPRGCRYANCKRRTPYHGTTILTIFLYSYCHQLKNRESAQTVFLSFAQSFQVCTEGAMACSHWKCRPRVGGGDLGGGLPGKGGLIGFGELGPKNSKTPEKRWTKMWAFLRLETSNFLIHDKNLLTVI